MARKFLYVIAALTVLFLAALFALRVAGGRLGEIAFVPSGAFVEQARPLLMETVEYEPAAVGKHLADPRIGDQLQALATALREISPFDESHVEVGVRGTAESLGMKAGALIHAARVAVTGRMASPGLFELFALLGRETTVARIERLVGVLAARSR